MSPLTTSGMEIASLDRAHRVPVGVALVELAARAAMHGDHAHAGVLRAARELGRIDRCVVPAEPHLQRHRHAMPRRRSPRSASAHDRGRASAPSRTASPATYFAGQPMLMSMICGAGGFGDARALRHPVRLAAGELHDVDAGALPFGAQHGVAAGPRPSNSLAVISETTSRRPSRDTRRRNGASVTPVIGASITRIRRSRRCRCSRPRHRRCERSFTGLPIN